MSAIQTQHRFRVDLDSCPLEVELPRPLSHSDALADEIILAVRRGMSPLDLTGMSVTGSLILSSQQTIALSGLVSGSNVTLPLTANCYAVPGPFTLSVQLQHAGVRHTLLRLKGQMARSNTEQLLPSGEVLPTLPELLTLVADVRQAATDARDAASPILLEAQGDTATITSAVVRPPRAVVTTIPPLQAGSGTPSRENVRPILPVTAASLYHSTERTEDAVPIAIKELPADFFAGTLDWVTGRLVCTHACITLAGTGVNWIRGTNNYYVEVNGIAEKSSLLCNQFVSSTKAATTLPEGTMRQGGIQNRVCFANPGNALLSDEWRALWDAQPIQLLYELAQPVTYTLSPHQLILLQGRNAIWSDAGTTHVTYITDTKAYIDERLAAIAASIA